MLKSTLILILLSFFVGAGVWLVFIWAVKRGEFDDIEGPKHRMLDDDDDPARGP
ncbi:cbb3-type cytochrome oxidase assembly protein CcoS [Geoalkalibacter sp.]|uniref:cbb3-type cytochrome oxidase assembly protein CcoS n=1 Tax=Geoalkalibacter sp. TaxID=3041440 RepID=UPI00272DD712|nr:cbb3-type cytochrome oxidase assembly protein CcoS [Geoalkalibacter sp.]